MRITPDLPNRLWVCAYAALLVVLMPALLVPLLSGPALSQPASALSNSGRAMLDAQNSGLEALARDKHSAQSLQLVLTLGEAVPYRAYIIGSPPRLVLDFRALDFGPTLPEDLAGADLVPAIRWGPFRHGWSRMVVELPHPARLETVQTRPNISETGQLLPGVVLEVRLAPVNEADFAPQGGDNPESALWNLPEPAAIPELPRRHDGRLRIMLDPGHGGIDPGAVVDGLSEADLMLALAQDLADLLRRAGIEVLMTRDADVFVPLEHRTTAARAASVDLFVSLHADALPEGEAAGTAFYIWSPKSNDRAAHQLAMLHDRDDLLAGMDLQDTDDEIADVLMDLARIENQPRSEALAGFMVAEAVRLGLPMHRRPRQSATFSVLKAPDIPSVLVETGFLTDATDRERLTDPQGRAALVTALGRAIVNWSHDDRIRAPLLRQ